MSNEEADRLKQQLNELKHQVDDYRVALEQYETGSATLTEKQKIIYEMFRAFVKDS